MRFAGAAVGGITVLAVALTGCAGSGSQDGGSGEVSVVATTTVWGDIAGQILACAGGEATALVPVGADPHDYQPSSQDLAEMVGADLVIANGLGLEEGLESTLQSAQQDGAQILEVAPRLDPIPFAGATDSYDGEKDSHSEEQEPHGDEGDTHSGDDPHVWLDAARGAQAARLIGDELAGVTGNEEYKECGEQVGDDLAKTDAEVRDLLAKVPPDKRILVTDHDAFGYFAEAYGFDVAGVVVPGGSTLGEPSSAEVADLLAVIEDTGVPAIFANTANPEALVDTLASEGGDVEVVDLFVGSLGEPGTEAGDYQGMVLTNAQRISAALGG